MQEEVVPPDRSPFYH